MMFFKRFLSVFSPVITGLLLALSFAPWSLWYAGLLALAGFSFELYRRNNIVRYTFVFALFYFGLSLNWVHLSLHHYGGATLFFALAANALLIIVMALFPTLSAYALGRCFPVRDLRRLLFLPLFWMVSEYARAYFLSGFPWVSLGYSQLESALSAYAPLGGVWLLGLVTWLVVVLPLAYWHSKKRFYLHLFYVLLAITLLLRKVPWTQPTGEALQVALLQGNVNQDAKFDREQAEAQLQLYLDMADAHLEAQVIVLPETAITYLVENGDVPLMIWLQERFQKRGQTLVTGVIEVPENHRYYNAVWSLDVERQAYHKRHLLPFGEFLPFRALLEPFRDYVTIPFSDFSRGASWQSALMTQGLRAGVSICFEAAFGREMRQALPADYLLNVSNDGWFRGSIAYDQHLQMNQMRSLELGREMVRATNTGLTAIINHRGRIKALLPRDEAGVLRGEVKAYRGLTPYALWGNRLFEALLLFYAFLCYRRCRRHEAL